MTNCRQIDFTIAQPQRKRYLIGECQIWRVQRHAKRRESGLLFAFSHGIDHALVTGAVFVVTDYPGARAVDDLTLLQPHRQDLGMTDQQHAIHAVTEGMCCLVSDHIIHGQRAGHRERPVDQHGKRQLELGQGIGKRATLFDPQSRRFFHLDRRHGGQPT